MKTEASLTYNADLSPSQIGALAFFGVTCTATSATTLVLAIGEQLDHEQAKNDAKLLEQKAQDLIVVGSGGYTNLMTEARELRSNNPPASDQELYALGFFGPIIALAGLYAAFKSSRLR